MSPPQPQRTALIVAVCTAFSLIACSSDRAAGSLGPPLSQSALRARLFAYASDTMRGRRAGTRDNDRATDYIAEQFRSLGLEPAGENGSFFQNVPLRQRMIADTIPGVSVGGHRLQPLVDYLPRDNGPEARAFDGASAIFGGVLGEGSTLLPGSDAVGRVVVLALKPGEFAAIKSDLQTRFSQAAAIAVVNLDLIPFAVKQLWSAPPVTAGTPERPAPGLPSYMHLSAALLTEIFGVPIAALTPGTLGAEFHGAIRFSITTIQSRNVIAILRGGDPELRNQFIAIGSHNDHEGVGAAVDADSTRAFNLAVRRLHLANGGEPSAAEVNAIRVNMDSIRRVHPVVRLDSVFNGADDDGTGTVAMIEIARAFAAERKRPRRSILFVSHAAEEEGLIGSAYFTDHPTVVRDSIVAQVNLDMIGRGGRDDETGGGPDYLQLVGSRRMSRELGDLVEAVTAGKEGGWKFDYSFDAPGHPDQLFCRSDHFNYARFGIPVVFISTGSHADYHEVTDEAEWVDYAKLSRVSVFVRDLLALLANLDHRVVVDRPMQDSREGCIQ